jgi:hypothetical protein
MVTPQSNSRPLDDGGEAEIEQHFARLQEQLRDVWAAMKRNQRGESIVVVPSVVPADPGHSGLGAAGS